MANVAKAAFLNQSVEYSVYYLRCLFCLTVHLMSIYSEGVHVFGVADGAFERVLGHFILRQTDVRMSQLVQI